MPIFFQAYCSSLFQKWMMMNGNRILGYLENQLIQALDFFRKESANRGVM
jgi:hypothetical protein